jgi:hypothetical protein
MKKDLNNENYKTLNKETEKKTLDGGTTSHVYGLAELILQKWLFY